MVECWLHGGMEGNGLNMEKMSWLRAATFHCAVHAGVRQVSSRYESGVKKTLGNSEGVKMRILG